MATDSARPLGGIRVVDLTTSLAGPYCTLILAALGADVVKIERRGAGDDTREWGPPFWDDQSAVFLSMNPGKRSVAIDLKTSEGLDALLRIAGGADVFVQNLRPGAADRLGLGFREVCDRNQRIVYCSITAYGSAGPRADQPGYDPLMQAAAGIMSITGEPGRAPVRAGVSVVDQGTGMWAALAILAALAKREQSGSAQLVETSLYETAVNWLPYQMAGYFATGEVPVALGSAIGMIAPYEAFPTDDGLVMIAAGNDRLFASLCEVLELDELPVDPRFRTNPDRVAHRTILAGMLAERVRRERSAELLGRLERAGVPAAPVQDIAAVAADPQTEALDLLQPIPNATVSGLRLVALPMTLDHQRLDHLSPPPRLGQHTREVLSEAGYSEDEMQELRSCAAIDWS